MMRAFAIYEAYLTTSSIEAKAEELVGQEWLMSYSFLVSSTQSRC
jgi:hypothetical protein